MSGFVDSEADEDFSDQEDSSKQRIEDSEDEEEDEKALIQEIDDEGNIKGLVNDDSEDDEDSDDEPSERKERERKRKRKRDHHHHRLDNEDFDLLEENLGVKIKKKKFNRLKWASSDEDEQEDQPQDARDMIQNQIFQGDDMEEDSQEQIDHQRIIPDPVIDVSGDEESEESDFIVNTDDEDAPTDRRAQKSKKSKDPGLAHLQEIFGTDFDFNDFQQYGDDEDEEDLDEEAYYDLDEDEDDDMGGYGRRPRKKNKKAGKYKSIYDVMEPETLARGFYTNDDKKIRLADIPERYQLRTVPIRPCKGVDDDLIEESTWIYKRLYDEPTISIQALAGSSNEEFSSQIPPSCMLKIQDILKQIREEHFTVPYIAFYRKEYVEPHLKIHDIFKIYHQDEKWTQLVNRKTTLKRLFKRMQTYQYEQISSDPEQPLGETRPLSDEDLERLHPVQTMEELRDLYMHFLLYYGKDIPKMKNAHKVQQMRSMGEEIDEEEEKNMLSNGLKQASRRDMYSVCHKAGLGKMAEKFGLTPQQFAENLRDNYQRHETSQYPDEPLEVAKKFICSQFPTEKDVLKGARYMVAHQLSREPLVRSTIRQVFVERAMVSCYPTKKGIKEIDEQHDCHGMRYLKNKPIKTFRGCQYLFLQNAEKEGLLNVTMSIDKATDHLTYYDEIKALYYRDEFSHLVSEWNKQRNDVLKFMLNQILYPSMVLEMRRKLTEECEEGIKEKCALKLRSYLSRSGYKIEENEDEESGGVVAMGIAYSEDRSAVAYAAVIDGNGELRDYLKLPDLRIRMPRANFGEPPPRNKDTRRLKDFIADQKPNVIAIGVQDRFATLLQTDLKACVEELESEGMVGSVAVELMDNELATVYSTTNQANAAFPGLPLELRQAVSMARRIQEPLLEFAQLCTPDEDILCLKLHPMQDQLDKEVLLEALYEEFIFRANEVGVDVNHAIAHPHSANIVQFVSGLGPRKAANLLKVLKQKEGRLENRSNLVTDCLMGPKIFINCAGFIKIDTKSLEDSTSYIEVLDGLRVHPETYDWARKMAVDALEYDESAEDSNPSSAISEILMSPEKLKDLDLDAFAVELDRQGWGKRGITLYDIRNELTWRYKDFREPYRPPTLEQRFEMVTKEEIFNFCEGKLVTCQVNGIAYRRLREDDRATVEHELDPATQLYTCSFCKQKGFESIQKIFVHVDSECPGTPVGVRTRFENGIQGFIPLDKLSDSQVTDPTSRVKPGMTIHCRIIKLDVERFKVDLSCRGSDLRDENRTYVMSNDDHFDDEKELEDKNKNDKKNKDANRTTYIKRVIDHINFHNIDYKTAEKRMMDMDDGDVIIRPSSKGADHLTVTWKVSRGVCSHIDVLEQKKANSFSLGKSLWIGQEEFEDLDEIIARYIQPMASNAREFIKHKYFREEVNEKEKIEEALRLAKRAEPTRIPYFISASKSHAGKFMLSYMPKTRSMHEYVTVTPDGFRYRSLTFNTINQLLKWYKEHYSDPLPDHLRQRGSLTPSTSHQQMSASRSGTTPAARTQRTPGRHTPRTPKATPMPRTPHTPSMPYVTPDPYSSHYHSSVPPSPRVGGAMLPPRTPPARMFAAAHKKTPRDTDARTPSSRQTPTTDWSRRPLPQQDWTHGKPLPPPQHSPRSTPRGMRTPSEMATTPQYRI